MALTLDSNVPMPLSGTTGGMGTGLAAGAGVIGGLLLGGLLGSNGNGLFGNNGNNGAVATAATTDVLLNPAFQSLQQQISGLSTALNTGDIQDSIARVNADLLQGQAALQTAMATGNFTTLSSINGLGRDITAAQNQAALQQLNSFNNLTTTTLQGFNGSAMQVQNATNQIIAQGTANAQAMQQCCCEIKGLILSDGNATRSLINDLNVQNLRDQLSAANNKVSNNEQNQYLLSTILTHLSPTPAVV